MNPQAGLERCLSFINCQITPPTGRLGERNGALRRTITISRQSGSGGHAVAERLMEYMQARTPKEAVPWTIFDRNLVEKVLEDHNLPKRLARFMPEDRISEISDTMDELFGLHPPSWTLVRQLSDTILRLAELGHVIIIGRGANVITARLDYALHVRLVGSEHKRVEHMRALTGKSTQEALESVRKTDLGRKRYLRKYFDKNIDDPLLYHLVINTDLIGYDEAAQMIGEAALGKKIGHKI